MNNPKVSVIMSVYNGEKYVREAVCSILNQTYKNFELIIINDGSTDRTQEILETFSDVRIRLVQQENLGLIKSLNKAIRMAKGEYIARHDADDISLPERFKKQVDFLEEHKDIALVGTFVVQIDEDGKEVKIYKSSTENRDIKDALWHDVPVCHASIMCRKVCMEKAGLYREKLKFVEDYDLLFRVSEAFDVANIAEPLYKVRINPDSICARNRFDQNRRYSLVRMLAKERRANGRDRLNDLTEEGIDELLDDIMPKTKRNEKRILASNCLYLAEVSYCVGNYTRAKEWLLRSICTDLFARRSWILFFKLLVRRILPIKRRSGELFKEFPR